MAGRACGLGGFRGAGFRGAGFRGAGGCANQHRQIVESRIVSRIVWGQMAGAFQK
jgi:hypothetical protein